MIQLKKEAKPKNARVAILKAARLLFVEKGFAAASMSQISKEAGVSRSLLFHHFTNKAELWAAVKAEIVEEAKAQEIILPSTELPFETFLISLVQRMFQFYREHPDILKMIAWQRVGEYENTGQSEESQQWVAAFKHYQKQGDIDAGLSPKFIACMVASAICSAVLDARVVLSESELEKAYPDFIAAQLLKSLRA